MSAVKIIHDRKKCIGCNSCVTIAPQNWMMDETEGKSCLANAKNKRGLFVGEIFDCDIEANKKAAAACPMNTIKVGSHG